MQPYLQSIGTQSFKSEAPTFKEIDNLIYYDKIYRKELCDRIIYPSGSFPYVGLSKVYGKAFNDIPLG